MRLCTISTGDRVYRYEKSIVAFFAGKRKVLSTSVYNGGYHENYRAVFNHDAKTGAGMPCEKLAPTYTEHMRIVAERLGLNPDETTGMGTAADMENAVVESLSYKELTVTAVVTGGIETNGGRAGDPADYYAPLEKPDRPGTINIMLFLDSDMPAGTLARALVTCTEAKTAAIQELMEGSHYSNGLATGSGTDQTIIVANAENSLYLEGAGKHSKMGELIGRVVKNAVKRALGKQSGLTPVRQHDVFRRLKRFGVTPESLWTLYRKGKETEFMIKPEFLNQLEILGRDNFMVTWTVLLIHGIDECLWGLLSEEETGEAAEDIMNRIVHHYRGTAAFSLPLAKKTPEDLIEAWKHMFLFIIENKSADDESLQPDDNHSIESLSPSGLGKH